jgi:hypothetical protein
MFGSSHCHTKIQRADSTSCFVSSAARQVSVHRLSIISAKQLHKSHCERMALMIF